MQAAQARRLREAWKAKGNPSCVHPKVEKEYDLGGDTGDEVCTTCGAAALRGTLRLPPKAT